MSVRTCRAEKERNVVVEYTGKTDLRVAWVDNVATISFKEDVWHSHLLTVQLLTVKKRPLCRRVKIRFSA